MNMSNSKLNRRKFIRYTTLTASAMGLLTGLPQNANASSSLPVEENLNEGLVKQNADPRIKFSVIGINHGHIYSQVEAVIRGGGELISVYAKEQDLLTAFTKRYSKVKTAGSEKEILDDKSIQLILSSAIPVDRAGIGIRAMKAGKRLYGG